MKRMMLSALAMSTALAWAAVPMTASAAVAGYVGNEMIVTDTNGVWDRVNQDVDKYVARGAWWDFRVVESDGGDYMMSVYKNTTGGTLTIQLYEQDGVGYTYPVGSPRTLSTTGDVIWRGIGDWVDGDNNKAEFMARVTTTGSYGYVSAMYYD